MCSLAIRDDKLLPMAQVESGGELSTTSEWIIQNGTCFVIFAYDAARSINLELAERRVHEATQRQTMPHKRRAPSYFEYQPPPLRVSQDTEPVHVGKFPARGSVDLLLYDFGAVTVTYSFPIAGPFGNLLQLSEELYDNELLLSDSRLRVNQLLQVMGEAATQASVAPVVEDYVIFHIESFAQPFDTGRFCSEQCRQIAQILRAERQILSDQEIDDAISTRISFGTEDLTIADWNAALLVDREGEDVRAVLDFANVELLEMRYLDQRLDRALDQAYDTLSRPSFNLLRVFGYYCAASQSSRSTMPLSSKASTTRSNSWAINISPGFTGWSTGDSTSTNGTRAFCASFRPSRASTKKSPIKPPIAGWKSLNG